MLHFVRAILFFVLTLQAADPSRVAEIVIQGNRKIEHQAIREHIKIKKGDLYSPEKVRESLDAIYQMGYFANIRVEAEDIPGGRNLVFIVEEKPTIISIQFQGNKKVDTSDLKEVSGLKLFTVLDTVKVNEAVKKMTRLYEEKGFFLAEVTYEVKAKEELNEVDLVFHVQELDKVKVRKIDILGNKIFSDEELKDVLFTKEGGFFSWLTKSDNFKEDIFQGDMQSLAFHYYSQGYVKAKVHKPIITLSPDKRWIGISLNVEEGEQFRVGNIDFSGDIIYEKNYLQEKLQSKGGDVFSSDIVRQDMNALSLEYRDHGYAFANVIPKTAIRDTERLVDIVFDFEKGELVHIGEIRIVGNTSTRDKVVRRELKINEGDLYKESLINDSIQRVQRLGYFSSVTYTKPVGKKEKTVDLELKVAERSTGSLSAGVGWSSTDNFIAQAQITHTNLFGRGHELSLNANISGSANRFSLSFTEPYTLDTLWKSGFDAFRTDRETTDFKELRTGGDLRVGHPIQEEWGLDGFLTYKLEDVKLKEVEEVNIDIIRPEVNNGITSGFIGTLLLDQRDDRFSPSAGSFHTSVLEFAGAGGDQKFIKGILKSRWYFPIIWDTVLRLNGETGFILRTTERDVPNTERFILGGVNSLRGFTPFSLGPTLLNRQGVEILVGGDRHFFSNVEYEIPLLREARLKGVFFYDVGSAFNGTDFSKIRHDVGFGFRWFSPFGPLRVEIGFPLDPQPGERKQVVQFAITPPF